MMTILPVLVLLVFVACVTIFAIRSMRTAPPKKLLRRHDEHMAPGDGPGVGGSFGAHHIGDSGRGVDDA